ncbi:peptidyl-prolyl cis-trans isomerase G-like isoform X3 [Ruditapes philippinarum]|uniref:peptidyl-prolyl cis-trans isomerase G-like isoform X3 n=1 Tax=Ruditapes philippinarum TaxID=129788 RepID=UPI00295B46C4|nr:peptidyl-prolyl cis-trans isomerase G-like isoform X3 [Ruditapes philippinarum]
MPPPRKSSPRRRDRRSRSRSHSPRRRRSRSRSRDRRRSKSPQRRRSPERKYRSPPRRKSPSPRKRSRSPKRRSRSPKRKSRSHSPRRRSRSQSPRRKGHSPRRSPSPGERIHPVKRPADSSGKRSGFRSRTPSPSPVKRSREERLYEDEVVYQQSQRSSKQARSPVHESTYSGKMYADQPSSSKKPLFPSGSSKRSAEIDFVTIVEKGPKREKLNKRFETHDQVAHGGFDFEENITIGIHRGPQHIELNDDDDIEVNYDFNPKTFRMLFPKKESYVKAIFDRDEIKAFHHDDILDEEAYVEKRTISIKPVDKPKSRKYNEELDYKITVGSSREGYGDRRMVQDSGSRPRSSRSSAYDDVPVTVRLDPKPDPRYEKMYRDQQRYEDLSLMQEKVHRNPNDLRYNLMRRKSDGDRDGGRDGRERQSGQSSMMDARSRIEARRQEGDHYDRRDRRTSHDSPPRRIERKKATVKTDLPDFKNRPDDFDLPPDRSFRHGKQTWGFCSICNVPLSSEQQAIEHVNGRQHCENENSRRDRSSLGSPARQTDPSRREFVPHSVAEESGWSELGKHRGSGPARLQNDDVMDRKRHRSTDSDFDRKDVKRRSLNENMGRRMSDYDGADYPGPELLDDIGINADTGPRTDSLNKIVWIIGTDEMRELQEYCASIHNYDLGLSKCNISVVWRCIKGLLIADVLPVIAQMKTEEPKPDCIVLHVGVNDIEKTSRFNFKDMAFEMIDGIKLQFPDVQVAWSQILPKERKRTNVREVADDEIAHYVLEGGGHYIHYPVLIAMDRQLFKMTERGWLEICTEGILKMMPILRGGLISIVKRHLSIVPVLKNLPTKVSSFVNRNMNSKFYPRGKKGFTKPKYFKKKFPFARR